MLEHSAITVNVTHYIHTYIPVASKQLGSNEVRSTMMGIIVLVPLHAAIQIKAS